MVEMSAEELPELLERHARPDLATAIDGVGICKVDYAAEPESSMSGTVLAVIAHAVTAVAGRLPGGREGRQTIKRTVETRSQYGNAVEVFGCHTGQPLRAECVA